MSKVEADGDEGKQHPSWSRVRERICGGAAVVVGVEENPREI